MRIDDLKTTLRCGVALAALAALPAAADWQPADAAELLGHCASPSWSEYMPCQAYLLERSRGDGVCTPAGTSAARLQLEFVRAGYGEGDAAAAADRFLAKAYPCS